MKLGLLLGVVLAVAWGAPGAASGNAWQVYRGSSEGVTITLALSTVAQERSQITVHFAPAADAFWHRVLQVGELETFCFWRGPGASESGDNTIDITLSATRPTQTFGADVSRRGYSYICGLHRRTEGPRPGQTWMSYLRSSLVSTRLRRVR